MTGGTVLTQLFTHKGLFTTWFADACGNTFVIGFFKSTDEARTYFRSLQLAGNWEFDSGLALLPSHVASVKMLVFEKDGTESQMCGNGARAVGALLSLRNQAMTIEVPIGVLPVHKFGAYDFGVRIDHLRRGIVCKGDPSQDIPSMQVLTISGEPHAVYAVEDLSTVPLVLWGSHTVPQFNCTVVTTNASQGNQYHARTYERGVNAITESCGTGAISAAWLLSNFGEDCGTYVINMHGHTLTVEIDAHSALLYGKVSLRPWENS